MNLQAFINFVNFKAPITWFIKIIVLFIGTIGVLIGNPACRLSNPSPQHPHIWIIGLDGATWSLLEPAMKTGDLPHLARLRANSAWGTLETLAPTISPVLWTTMATGLPLEYHGITAWNKGGHLITANWRHGVPFWEIADRSGYHPAVINWWATYPVTQLKHGWMISDRYRNGIHDPRYFNLPGLTHPAQLVSELRPYFTYLDGRTVDRLMRTYGFPVPRIARRQFPVLFEKTLNLKRLRSLPGYIRQDLIIESVTNTILDRYHPDVLAVTFRIIDVYAHLVLSITPTDPRLKDAVHKYPLAVQKQLIQEGRWSPIESDLNLVFSRKIRPALKLIDDMLGRILARRPRNSYVILVSDHGFRWSGEHLFDHQAYPGIPLAHGMYLINGPGLKTGHTENLSIYDIAPLVLALMGAPISQELKGTVPISLFRNPRRIEKYLKFVPAYRRFHHEVNVDEKTLKAGEQPLREDLKTLGYIQ